MYPAQRGDDGIRYAALVRFDAARPVLAISAAPARPTGGAKCHNRGMTARAGQGKVRHVAAGVVLALVGLAAAGCSDRPLDASGAATAYGPVVDAVTKATGDALGVEWTRGSDETTQRGDHGCRWYSTSFETATDLSSRMPEVRQALDSSLGDLGFADAQDEQLPGGWVAVTATDDQDARVAVQAKGRSTVRLSVPVSGDC